METNIKIQYFGVVRLLFNIKEEIIETHEILTLEALINVIDKKYGHDFLKKAYHLMFFYYKEDGVESQQMKFPRDKDVYMKNKSTIKIFNALTLG